jgi:hypothetical protein
MFEQYLHQMLYRFDCPSPDVLRDYHWGYLPAERRQQVEEHLRVCPRCAAEAQDLAEFVASEPFEPSSRLLSHARQAAEQVRLVIARLISPEPGLAPVLRGETREVLLFDADGMALSVNLEQGSTGTCTLFGQVLSPEPAIPPGCYVRLTGSGETMVPLQVALDENGGFALPGLKPGFYQLVVKLPERRILVPIFCPSRIGAKSA